MSIATLLMLSSLWGAYAPQRMGTEMLEPAQETRVQALAENLRCAVCQGVSIADSPASMARAQLDKVRELVSQGKTDEEIREYFVARYGEWVLMTPTTEGFNLTVWVMPAILLIAGIFIIFGQVGKRSPEANVVTATTPTAEDEYLRRVRAEMEE